MMLRTHHFAAMRINWNDKATSLREIAEELNIGIDSIAFVDDNPMEREWVRTQLPEVEVIDLPDDPRGFEEALRAAPVFERVSLSTEDRERGKYYSQQRLRDGLHSASASVEEFYASLDMSMDVKELDASTLARAVQLAQKTNQFNLTTRRYSLQELTEKMNDPNWQLYVARVVDRFGDNGWAAFAAVLRTRKVSEIDNLLLSCRVIGRAVETALLAVIVERAYADGIRQLRGTYIPSAKNGPAKSFYPQHGFKLIAESDAEAKWSFDLTGRTIGIPKWIRMMEAPRATGVPAQ
jgi:FkbH-like protein